MSESGLVLGEDGVQRCWWCSAQGFYRDYHDQEWSEPVMDDDGLFERIALEGFQAGLSWSTVLQKRDAFRRGFHYFAIDRVAEMGAADVEILLQDAGIIRHRGKIEATIANARALQEIIKERGSVAAFLAPWFVRQIEAQGPTDIVSLRSRGTTPIAKELSTALKKRGMKFVGPTGVYAMMQALGVANDHVDGCHSQARGTRAQARWLEFAKG